MSTTMHTHIYIRTFKFARKPRNEIAALSYARAASTSVVYPPKYTCRPFVLFPCTQANSHSCFIKNLCMVSDVLVLDEGNWHPKNAPQIFWSNGAVSPLYTSMRISQWTKQDLPSYFSSDTAPPGHRTIASLSESSQGWLPSPEDACPPQYQVDVDQAPEQ